MEADPNIQDPNGPGSEVRWTPMSLQRSLANASKEVRQAKAAHKRSRKNKRRAEKSARRKNR